MSEIASARAARVVGSCEGQALDVKRFYLPGVTVQVDCECGALNELPMDGAHYLFYPLVGHKKKITTACLGCEKELAVDVVLRVSLELA